MADEGDWSAGKFGFFFFVFLLVTLDFTMTDTAIKNLQSRLEQVSSRLASVEKQLASGGGGAPAAASGGAPKFKISCSILMLLRASTFDQYVELSASINPLVKQQAELVNQAVIAHRQFLQTAAQSRAC